MNKEFREMVARRNFVIMDTETTGLDYPAEICQIAIIDPAGKPLLNTLVRTKNPIPGGATFIHGIDNEMVENAPIWLEVLPAMLDIIAGKELVIYNADYDTRLVKWSNAVWELPEPDYRVGGVWCAMEAYAALYGEWNPRYGNYKWQSLSNAMRQQGLEVAEDAHSALADCQMTLKLIEHCCKEA